MNIRYDEAENFDDSYRGGACRGKPSFSADASESTEKKTLKNIVRHRFDPWRIRPGCESGLRGFAAGKGREAS